MRLRRCSISLLYIQKHNRSLRNTTPAAADIYSDDDDNDECFLPESPLVATDLSWIAQPAAQNRSTVGRDSPHSDMYASPPQAWPDRRPINSGRSVLKFVICQIGSQLVCDLQRQLCCRTGLDATPPTPHIPSSAFIAFKLKDRLDDEDADEGNANGDSDRGEGSCDSPSEHLHAISPAKTPLGRRVMNQHDSPISNMQPHSDDER